MTTSDEPSDDKLGLPSQHKPTSGLPPNVPVATVTRLALYLRELQQLERTGIHRIQSSTIAKRLGLKDAQVRRDLSCFGQFGQRGVGYNISGLCKAIQAILGTDRSWNVILVGAGNLGRALSGYRGFDRQGFRLVGVFDCADDKIGSKLGKLTIQSLDELGAVVEKERVELAILAVPAEDAAIVAQKLEIVGVTGILNFAPVTVRRPNSNLTVVDVDLAVELQRLAFAVVNQKS
ncbi:MAG: redox-sensing transcriptional repressor Rex [Pirellula sp.]